MAQWLTNLTRNHEVVGSIPGLHQSHSNLGSEPRLGPTLKLMATPDPEPTEQGQGANPQPHGS